MLFEIFKTIIKILYITGYNREKFQFIIVLQLLLKLKNKLEEAIDYSSVFL